MLFLLALNGFRRHHLRATNLVGTDSFSAASRIASVAICDGHAFHLEQHLARASPRPPKLRARLFLYPYGFLAVSS